MSNFYVSILPESAKFSLESILTYFVEYCKYILLFTSSFSRHILNITIIPISMELQEVSKRYILGAVQLLSTCFLNSHIFDAKIYNWLLLSELSIQYNVIISITYRSDLYASRVENWNDWFFVHIFWQNFMIA